MEGGIQEIKDLFYKDKLPQAYKKLRQLEEEFKDDPNFKALVDQTEELFILREDIKEADKCLELLADLDTWELVKETDNIAIFSKTSARDFLVRAELLIETPFFPVLSVFNEIELLPEWIQVLKSVTVVSELSHFRRVLWYKFNLPWPASNRDMIVNAFGVTLPENNSIMVLLRQIEGNSFLGAQIPDPDGGDVRITLKTGLINLMKRADNQTQVSFIVHSDPHVAIVPESLLNYCTQTAIYYFMKSMHDQATQYSGSIYEKRINEKSEIYQEITEILKEVFGESS
jgi:hypothetical protein